MENEKKRTKEHHFLQCMYHTLEDNQNFSFKTKKYNSNDKIIKKALAKLTLKALKDQNISLKDKH